ncbi:2713_t:CDS:2 [Paraglomus brasilianum]|uniref:2713_t:CDS:1 n=1 Tax=Paraglomus brasilianum TaxID=144538 RepID=A0A9N9FH79_9GLOM|nr:2713_t:CDS:2 [Paraglomus brasilianum]
MIEIKDKKDIGDCDSKNVRFNERIILNVGGVKYETYRSTLTAYPNTLLGTMFADRNLSLLYKTDGNEYFIDRNGHAFFYILEFYRTGRLSWKEEEGNCICGTEGHLTIGNDRGNITREELISEMQYFQLPVHTITSSFIHRAAGQRLTHFMRSLEKVLHILASEFQTSIRIDFRKNKLAPHITILSSGDEDTTLKAAVIKVIKPHGTVGYVILSTYGNEIKRYLESEVEGVTLEVNHVDNFNWFRLEMKINGLENNLVLENSVIIICMCMYTGVTCMHNETLLETWIYG